MPPTDNPKTRSRSGPIAAMVVGAVLLPLFYLLGIGPAAWMAACGHIDESTFAAVYVPLMRTSRNVGFYEPLMWYMRLWIP